MNWFMLIIAGLLETGWAVIAILTSLGLLGIAMRTLPAGTAYAIWVGIGVIGTVIFGIAFLGESANMLRILGLVFIVTGIIFLKLANHA